MTEYVIIIVLIVILIREFVIKTAWRGAYFAIKEKSEIRENLHKIQMETKKSQVENLTFSNNVLRKLAANLSDELAIIEKNEENRNS